MVEKVGDKKGMKVRDILREKVGEKIGEKVESNKAKAISAKLLELNLKNKLEETGKTR